MPEEIFQGHDCSKEAKVTTRTDKKTGEVTEYHRALKLEKKLIVADFRETVMLKLMHVHALCDDSCYHWRQVRGGGYLIEEYGPEVGFVVPHINKKCENSAVIKVYLGKKRLDTAYITTTAYATPPHVLRWYEKHPFPWDYPGDEWKYRAYAVKSTQLYRRAPLDQWPLYTPVAKPSFPTPKRYDLIARIYDCNHIFLHLWRFSAFHMGTTQEAFERVMKEVEAQPMVVDMRTPFLKGEPVTLDEGATIPFGWQPNARKLPGLTVPYGTIWPEGWKSTDPLPEWECCPPRLVEAEYEATKGY